MEQAGYVDRTGQKATDCRCYRLPTYPLHRSQIFSTAHTTNFLDGLNSVAYFGDYNRDINIFRILDNNENRTLGQQDEMTTG